MDLKKLKGINWVGNIYQKFEAICQEVDGIVNQDTIKYVEVKVQTVGKSVKKLYSDVVQDYLPTSRDPVKDDAQDVVIKENSTISTNSRENLEEDYLDATEKQSPREPNVIDPVTNQLSLVTSKYDIADQPASPISEDALEVSEFDLSVGQNDEVLANVNSLAETEKQSPTEPNVVDPVANHLTLVSSEYHCADQPSFPTLMDNVEVPESDLSEGKIDEVWTNENSIDATENQSPAEPNVMDPVTNQLILVSGKYHLADQPSFPTSVDTLEVLESDLSVGELDEKSLDATENQSPEEPNTMDPVANLLPNILHKYHLADQRSFPTSMDLEVSDSDLSEERIDDTLTNENSDENNEEISIKVSAPILLELTSPFVSEHCIVSPTGVFAHSHHDKGHAVLPEVAPESPAHRLEFQSQQQSTVSDNSSDEVECISSALNTASEMAFSVVSGENKIEKMGLASLSSSNAKEYLRLSEYSPQNLSLEAMLSNSSVQGVGCISDGSDGIPSSALPLTVSGKNKDMVMELSLVSSVLSLELVAEGTSKITGILPLIVPSRKQQVQICESVQYDALKSSSDIGFSDESSCDFSPSSMETIDLHDKVKLDESCVVVEDSVLHDVSCRARKLRSYKKRIQDAFTSKKRLAKEYEQLAIWFGDIDIDSSQETLPNMKNLHTHHDGDSEWELV